MLLAGLFASGGGVACTLLPHSETAYAGERFDQATALTTKQLTADSMQAAYRSDHLSGPSGQRGFRIPVLPDAVARDLTLEGPQ